MTAHDHVFQRVVSDEEENIYLYIKHCLSVKGIIVGLMLLI